MELDLMKDFLMIWLVLMYYSIIEYGNMGIGLNVEVVSKVKEYILFFVFYFLFFEVYYFWLYLQFGDNWQDKYYIK